MYCVYTATSCMKNVVKFTHKIGKTFGFLLFNSQLGVYSAVYVRPVSIALRST